MARAQVAKETSEAAIYTYYMAQVCVHDSFDLFGFCWNELKKKEKHQKKNSIWNWNMLCERPDEIFRLGQLLLLRIRQIVLCNIGQFLFACPICSVSFSLLLASCAWDFRLLCFLCSKSFASYKLAILGTNKPSKACLPLLVVRFVCTFRCCFDRLCSALQFPKLIFFFSFWKEFGEFLLERPNFLYTFMWISSMQICE